MTKQTIYSPELRERAVHMLLDHQGEDDSQWAAMSSIAAKFGCTLIYTLPPHTICKLSGRLECARRD